MAKTPAKFDDSSTFLCHQHGKSFAKGKKGRLINTTDPNQKCAICKADNARLEFRPEA